MDHQKPTILLSTFSLGGCGGHPMQPKLNLKDKRQMSHIKLNLHISLCQGQIKKRKKKKEKKKHTLPSDTVY